MSTTLAIVFIIGKAAIWLALPAALGIWELRRHRRMMAAEARGEPVPPAISGWLQRPDTRRAAVPAPAPAEVPAPAPDDVCRAA